MYIIDCTHTYTHREPKLGVLLHNIQPLFIFPSLFPLQNIHARVQIYVTLSLRRVTDSHISCLQKQTNHTNNNNKQNKQKTEGPGE